MMFVFMGVCLFGVCGVNSLMGLRKRLRACRCDSLGSVIDPLADLSG